METEIAVLDVKTKNEVEASLEDTQVRFIVIEDQARVKAAKFAVESLSNDAMSKSLF